MQMNTMIIKKLLNELRQCIENPIEGLPEEIFLFATEITPMVNVDLLVRDDAGRILLAWRNDPWYGDGWHVPGSIVRVKESFDERIQKCAIRELHSKVNYKKEPLEMFQIIEKEFKTRCHFFSFVFECKLPDGYQIDNGALDEHDTGFLAWHGSYPVQMLRCHEVYRKYFAANI